jgi:hypothetical protein
MADPDANPPERPAGGTPALRASDADRELIAERLRLAASEGRLTFEELDERLDAAYGARTHGELARLVADVALEEELPSPAAGRRSGVVVRPGGGGASWLVSVMGGHDRRGRWRVSPSLKVVNVMGGSDLDFNDAELAAQEIEITVVSVMGGADIRVPEDANVEISDFALMGGNGVEVGEPRPRPGAPTFRIRLISVMGGTDVKRGRKLSRRERRELRERERHRVTHGDG